MKIRATTINQNTLKPIEKEKFDPSLPTAFKMPIRFALSIEQFFLLNQ
ncbi:MAG: hypothetical protein P8H38_06515 [Flavobacteriaceae bacterium]|jgi:DNA-binding XRE family transcriptional regulator|nr:hypothetical protein [Flavobacteriaceae bacterium]